MPGLCLDCSCCLQRLYAEATVRLKELKTTNGQLSTELSEHETKNTKLVGEVTPLGRRNTTEGIFSRWTNQTQEARVYSRDGPI